jgi:pimeloyl-ACP methyl ester carboxylesterase
MLARATGEEALVTEVAEVHGRLELAGATLFVRQWGRETGPALLFVHHLGIAGSSLHLAEVARGLAADYGLRVVAPDLPGFGGSPPLAAPDAYRPDELASLLVGLLDRLGVARAGYAGLSWGATIGCHVADRAADRLRALVLLDGGHVDAGDQPGFEVDASLSDRVRAARRHLGGFAFRRLDDALDTVSDDYPRWTPELEESWKAGLRVVDGRIRPRLRPEVYAAAVHGLAAAPPSTTWPAIRDARLPVLLVTPADAAGSNRQHSARERFAAAIPRADVRVVREERHDLVAALGPALVRLVGDWLRGDDVGYE